LHVIESMGMGGAERHLANLLAPLHDLGVENHLATLWSESAYSDAVTPFATHHDFALPPRKMLPALPGLLKVARSADVVHTQLPWADIAGRLAAIGAGKPSVTTLQSTWYDEENLATFEPKVRRNVRLVRQLDRWTARSTRRFFAVSAATGRTYEREVGVPRERIQILPNSVDLNRFDPSSLGGRAAARAALGCADGELALAMVARLVPPKGHADAIHAVAALREVLPLRLYVAGTGPEEERLRALAAEKGAPVTFLGACRDIPRLLLACDLFLFPTMIEGMPLALIEAMAMGLPCLCSDIPENREAGGDQVAYSIAGKPDELASALRVLLGDRDRRARLAGGARTRSMRFSSRTVAAELLRSIEDVLRSSPRSRLRVVFP
jgi:glycosyltransferase involved in cell wall biosynthesis